jgi:photosystem II stability/assembly factor-like uncharacterized protein
MIERYSSHSKITLVALFFLMVAAASPMGVAAERWHKLQTVPYTLNIKQDAISFVDAKTGWYGNGTGRVFRTRDAGDHWQQSWIQPGTYVRALEFIDRKTGFLGNLGPGYFPHVRDPEPLYVTHDAGTTWSPVVLSSGSRIKGVCAIDVLKINEKVVAIRAGGRVGGPAAMMESFDEGRTWSSRDMSGVTGMILDIHFVDEHTGFIAGATEPEESKAHARILKTSDSGKTWRAVFESPRVVDNNWKLAFPSAKVGYATIMSYNAPKEDARGYVVKTEDGGESWKPLVVTKDTEWIPYGINFLDENHGWVGGSTAGYETIDGGKTWRKANMGLYVNKIRFLPKPDGGVTVFAIGKDVYRAQLRD